MTPTGGDVVIDVGELRMRYGATQVLRDVTFQAQRGEVLALLGPNGAGKTTTMEILEGFRRRSAGRVQVLGSDPEEVSAHWRARVGIVLQSWRDHGRWRVRELLAHLGSYYAGQSTEQITRPWDADELLALVGLTEHANSGIGTLSGGQRRRLDLAIGVVGRPEVLFLDEPTAGFDPEMRRECHGLVRRLADDEQTTILLTTHDLNEAENLADRILILIDGRIVADGTAKELGQRFAGTDEVRWTRDGQHFVESTTESTRFAWQLFRQYGESIADLEVRRTTLEESYLGLVRPVETENQQPRPAAQQEMVRR
jgi:ABC-2 type transport system ATP-binding protein